MKQKRQTQNNEKSTSDPLITPMSGEDSERDAASPEARKDMHVIAPAGLAGSGSLDRLIVTAKDYARQATAENTNAAYKADWAHFSSWCRRRGADPLPPSPELIGLYIANCASPDDGAPALSVSTIERRLSGLAWHSQQRGFALARKDRHIATILAGIKRKHARPPVQKEAVLAEDILDMIATLSFGLRDQRDRTILLIGYAGGLRRSEIVSLDINRDDTDDGKGCIAIEERGLILTFRGKTGWREVEIGRGSTNATCPVHALEQYLHYSKIDFGPLFQRVTRDDRKVTGDRLSDKHVARLIKKTVRDAGIRSDLPEKERLALFSGHSLRAGLASSADVDERYVQKQLGHASPEMTRRYQRRRDRFRVNLTKAAGL
ncbi:MAG: tyrosine-type recombinase/integrase [Rhodobacteraceae bacterium]|nr:tyrosine-type recombinase/integrase [Paracoccaceae bacterium]